MQTHCTNAAATTSFREERGEAPQGGLQREFIDTYQVRSKHPQVQQLQGPLVAWTEATGEGGKSAFLITYLLSALYTPDRYKPEAATREKYGMVLLYRLKAEWAYCSGGIIYGVRSTNVVLHQNK